jgi:hypothetical protein
LAQVILGEMGFKIVHMKGNAFAKVEIKIFFSQTSLPNSIELGTNHPWVKGIHTYSNKGPDPLQKGDYHKNLKIGLGYFKVFFSRTTGPETLKFTQKLSYIVQIQVCTNRCP